MDVIYNPYSDRQEAIAGVVVSIRDITERKRAEEERRTLQERLHRAEKMEALGTLAGGVAHDLNNVLGIVVGYSELLLDDLDESSSARSEAMEILKSGNRAAAIVQDWGVQKQRLKGNFVARDLDLVLLPPNGGFHSPSPCMTF